MLRLGVGSCCRLNTSSPLRLRPRSTIFCAHMRDLSSSSTYYYNPNGKHDEDEPDNKVALVLGSSGCLGQAICHHFSKNLGMQVIGADVAVSSSSSSSVDRFIHLPTSTGPVALGDSNEALVQGISQNLNEHEELDTIICAAGAWAGDPPLPKSDATDEEFLQGARDYGSTINRMLDVNLYPVLAAGYAANRFMAEDGLFVVIGATVALSPTPGMLGYGISKAAVHHFVQTLGETTGKSVTTKERRQKARRLRKGAPYLDTLSVVGILPTTLDTPANRTAMPQANFERDWTKPSDIAKEIGTWIETPALRPHSGSLVKVHPSKTGSGATFTIAR